MAHPLPIESSGLTDYDRANVVAYIKLLDAVAAGVDWRAATTSIFGVDAGADESLARQVFDANLARALDDPCRLPADVGVATAGRSGVI